MSAIQHLRDRNANVGVHIDMLAEIPSVDNYIANNPALQQELQQIKFTDISVPIDNLANHIKELYAAYIYDGVSLSVPVTGTYSGTITPTIVDGAVTGFVLS